MMAHGRSLHLVLAATLAVIVAVASCADPPPPRGQSRVTGPQPALSPEDARAVLAAIDRQSTERPFVLPHPPPAAAAPTAPAAPVAPARTPQPEPDSAAPLAADIEQAAFASEVEAASAKRVP